MFVVCSGARNGVGGGGVALCSSDQLVSAELQLGKDDELVRAYGLRLKEREGKVMLQ